jgi:hypothetical protein
VDAPRERSTRKYHAEPVDRTAPVQPSGRPPADPSGMPGVSGSYPLGPLTTTASYNTRAPGDTMPPSGTTRLELGGAHPRTPQFPHDSRAKVPNDERRYPKPAAVVERVPLHLDHTLCAADVLLLRQTSYQPHSLARNNSRLTTNEDLDPDPKNTTDKVSPVQWTAGADSEETEVDQDDRFYDATRVRRHPESARAPQSMAGPRSIDKRTDLDTYNTVQRNASYSTHGHNFNESPDSRGHHQVRSWDGADRYQPREGHVYSPRAKEIDRTGSFQPPGKPFVYDPPSLEPTVCISVLCLYQSHLS